MGIEAELKADVEKVEAVIKEEFTTLKGQIVAFFTASASAIVTTIEEQAPKDTADLAAFVEKSAMDSVAAAETTPGGGGQAKMTAALAAFGVDLATKGITLAETDMRNFLEAALVQFKAASAPAAVATTPAKA